MCLCVWACVCVFVRVCACKEGGVHCLALQKLLINSNVIQKPFLFMHHCMNKANGGNKKNIICPLTFGSISIPEKNDIERGKIEFMFLGPLITIIAWNICRFLLTLSLTPLVLLNDFLWAAVCFRLCSWEDAEQDHRPFPTFSVAQ